MIKDLTLYDVHIPKIRLGHYADGGYVLPVSLLAQSESLFTYGVGTDISFEKDYSFISNKKAFLYDHTIENIEIPELYQDLIFFKKEGLFPFKNDNGDNFFNHYKERKAKGKVLLKMDIEESEFAYFLNTDIALLSEVTTGLIVEFHLLGKSQNLIDFFKVIHSLNEYFFHCHFHGNNYASTLLYEENGYKFEIPHALEMTFINKSLVKESSIDTRDYPDSYLDRPNELSKKEISLYFLKMINYI